MPKFLITKDTGPTLIEADEAQLVGSGMLVFFDMKGDSSVLVAAFIPGRWVTFEKVLDSKPLVH